MTIEEYLNRCRDLRKRAEKKKRKYEDLRSAASSTAVAFDRNGGGKIKDPRGRENVLAAMVDAGQEAELAELDYIDCRHNLFMQLIRLPNRDESEVLIMRYVEEQDIVDICKALSTGRRNVFRYLRTGKDRLRDQLQGSGLDVE